MLLHLVGFLQPRITMHVTTNIKFYQNVWSHLQDWRYDGYRSLAPHIHVNGCAEYEIHRIVRDEPPYR